MNSKNRIAKKTILLQAHDLFNSQTLKNGVVLCQLMNKISPGSVKKFKTSGPAFLLMENISAFQVSGRGSGWGCWVDGCELSSSSSSS